MKFLSSNVRITFLSFICAIAFFSVFINSALAYTITPKVIDLDLEQRDIINKTITLKNDSAGQVRIYTVVNEVSVDDDGEIKNFELAVNEEQRDSITSWIEISRGRIVLKPGEEKEIPLKIHINPQAEAGEYHAFIAFANAKDKFDANQKALAGKAPGTVVRIALEQNRTEFLKLDGFIVDRIVTDTNENVLRYKIANTGEKELTPSGEVIFYDTRGNEVGAIPVNTERVEIKSGQEVEFESPIPEEISVGKYKAFMSMQYGTDQLAALTDTSFFYVVPIEVLIIIFVSVLVFALILTILIYRRLNLESVNNHTQSVSMYRREGVSESQEHDIDLKIQHDKTLEK